MNTLQTIPLKYHHDYGIYIFYTKYMVLVAITLINQVIFLYFTILPKYYLYCLFFSFL